MAAEHAAQQNVNKAANARDAAQAAIDAPVQAPAGNQKYADPGYFTHMSGERPEGNLGVLKSQKEGPLREHYDRLLIEHNGRAARMQRIMDNQGQRDKSDALRRQQRANLEAAQNDVIRQQAAQRQLIDSRRVQLADAPVVVDLTHDDVAPVIVAKPKMVNGRPKVPTEPTRKSVRTEVEVKPKVPAKSKPPGKPRGKAAKKQAVEVKTGAKHPRVVIKRRRVVCICVVLTVQEEEEEDEEPIIIDKKRQREDGVQEDEGREKKAKVGEVEDPIVIEEDPFVIDDEPIVIEDDAIVIGDDALVAPAAEEEEAGVVESDDDLPMYVSDDEARVFDSDDDIIEQHPVEDMLGIDEDGAVIPVEEVGVVDSDDEEDWEVVVDHENPFLQGGQGKRRISLELEVEGERRVVIDDSSAEEEEEELF
jgi:hypothetical protein